MSSLKEALIRELSEEIKKGDARIKQLDKEIDADTFAISTINGGAFAKSAENSCRNRIAKANMEKTAILKSNAWRREMLTKYK